MRKYLFIAAFCGVIIGGGFWLLLRQAEPPETLPESAAVSGNEEGTLIPPEKIIDYGKLKDHSDKALSDLMKERKEAYGIESSIDMIVRSDESIRVGDKTVPVQKILDEVRLTQGKILETDLKTGARKGKPGEFGIHVVQQNNNIWDIHFKLLKDYYKRKGIQLSPLADEPDHVGRSSGVGKILKFSEHMVQIYNLKEHKVETNLDQIYPLSKIVIYNMGTIYALLDRIDYKDVNRIEFDGETLWLPAEQ